MSTHNLVRASDPNDILAVIPYLLTFHPEDSVILLVLRGGRVVVTARKDLRRDDDVAGIVAHFAFIADRYDAEAVVVAAYSDNKRLGLAALDQVLAALDPIEVIDALYADGARWWSRRCSGPQCCPAEGTPYDVATSKAAAQAVAAGLPALPSRQELVDQAAGPARGAVAGLEVAFEASLLEIADAPLEARCDQMAMLVEAYCLEPHELSAQECATLATLAYDVIVRDVAWLRMRRTDAEVHVDLWSQVVRHTLPPFELAPLCLLGMAAWIGGNGALQVVCIDRASAINPGYTMLRILEDINHQALPPSLWDEMSSVA